LVIVGSSLIGALLSWLLVPVVYVERALLYEQPNNSTATPTSRGNWLYTRAAQLESPAFVQGAALLARGTVTSKHLARAAVHAEVDRRTDITTLSVEHPDPKIAEALTNALIKEAINSATVAATQPATGSADPRSVALGKAVAQVASVMVILEAPLPASQLTPHFTPLSWAVFFVANFAIAVILLLMLRRWIFGANDE
jgi:hypothetical protein